MRQRILVTGLVQGVGFRPFVHALAAELGLCGQVGNTGAGVLIEVQGEQEPLITFKHRLTVDAPTLAVIHGVHADVIGERAERGFRVVESVDSGGRTLVSPDIATCTDCLAELADPADRRYRHPFISCTNCGPRFTVISSLPYDRPNTTMAELPLCRNCFAEYDDPANRRFHAQTIACPDCGPTLALEVPAEPRLTGDAAVVRARELLAEGAVLAVKGLGGYHLACDGTDEHAVAGLRKRKDRGDKPFAVMVADLAAAAEIAYISETEGALLRDPRRPVVLLSARAGSAIAASVAPGRDQLGVLLAYTPIHQLLLAGGSVLVMTSGNLAGEPIVTDDDQARIRLSALADGWLGHDRPIQLPCDDSVVRVAGDRVLPIRRSRGYAPLPIALPLPVRPALAVGGDLKNTFCLAAQGYAWLSAHVGDMDDLATLRAFEIATGQLAELTGVRPELIVADRHPAYRSSAWARRNPAGLPVTTVQHHHAHIASVMAENGHDGSTRVIGFAFDGTGFGDDGAVWGGEALIADYDGYVRAGQLRYVPLPGGNAGVRNPCRMALAHLSAAGLDWDPRLPAVAACSPAERAVLSHQLGSGLQCTPTSSMGRLFDAMSALAGVCQRVAYEAEAAMLFEQLAVPGVQSCQPYTFGITDDGGRLQFEAAPVLAAAVADLLAGAGPDVVAARFHRGVADLVVTVAVLLRERSGLATVALSGGVFLNAVLTILCERQLDAAGFAVLSHHLVPPSDAGLALGQLAIAARYDPGVSESPDSQRRTPCA